jgi:hypothetical protein
MNDFDFAVTSDTGDVWEITVDPATSYTPLTVEPGALGTIHLAITPTAPVGTVVRGTIAVDTFNLFTFACDEIIVFPYSYTVGP